MSVRIAARASEVLDASVVLDAIRHLKPCLQASNTTLGSGLPVAPEGFTVDKPVCRVNIDGKLNQIVALVNVTTQYQQPSAARRNPQQFGRGGGQNHGADFLMHGVDPAVELLLDHLV